MHCCVQLFHFINKTEILAYCCKTKLSNAYLPVSGGKKSMPVLPSTRGKHGMIFMPHGVGQVWLLVYLCSKPDFDEKIISSSNLITFIEAQMIYLYYKTSFILIFLII